MYILVWGPTNPPVRWVPWNYFPGVNTAGTWNWQLISI
jgi:hypothetical protein